MSRLFSIQVSIPTIVVLFMGGLTIMISPINNSLTIWWNPITALLWVICLGWLAAVVLYRKQKVDINIEECTLSKSASGDYNVKTMVLISSRHPDVLRKIELGMQPEFTLPSSPTSIMPYPIHSVFRKLEVTYSFGSGILDKAMKQQNTAWDIVLWLEGTTSKAQWLTDGFLMPVKTIQDGIAPSIERSRKEGGLNRRTQKKKGRGLGINHKHFTQILKKVSQPIEKSEKEKP